MASRLNLPFEPPVLIGIAAGLVLAVWIAQRVVLAKKGSKLPLPPGPKGRPILGVTGEMVDTTVKAWRKFQRWSKELDAKDLLRIETLNQTSMIINSAAAAHALLNKRGGIYADRPRNAFYTEMVEKNMVLANIHGNPDAVRRRRNMLHDLFNSRSVELWQSVQLDESRSFLVRLMETPLDHVKAIQTTQRATIVRNVYSDVISVPASDIWATVDKAAERIHPGIEGFIRLFPILSWWPSWLPGGGFHRLAKEWHEEDRERWTRFQDNLKAQMRKGKSAPSFLTKMIEDNAGERYKFNDLEIAWAAGNLLTAGGDLPDITIRIFVIAMLHFPQIYARLQSELDHAVGPNRLPDFDDKPNLPYLRAVILETQRWRPLSPIGIPHRCTEENEYGGMRIPKGTLMYPNLWMMCQDPTVYPEPDEFKPERFLGAEGKSLNRKIEAPSFGFGKRMCSAANLAENNLFINIASLAWGFDLVPPKGTKGETILPDIEPGQWFDRWDGILALDPPPCQVETRIRSAEREALVRADRRAAKGT